MSRCQRLLGLLLLGSFAGSSATAGTVLLDQSFVPADPSVFYEVRPGFPLVQTFTVGITGQLSALTLDLQGSGTDTPIGQFVSVELYAYSTSSSGIVLGSAALASATTSLDPLAGSTSSVDLAFGGSGLLLDVVAGQQLAILLRFADGSGGRFGWLGTTSTLPAGYAGGEAFGPFDDYTEGPYGGANFSVLPSGPSSGVDYGFKTYVTVPDVVPEPSSFVLAGLGALGLGVFARRRAVAFRR